MNSLQETKYLAAMALIEQISEKLETVSYIWGGFTIDIYSSRYLRDHSDIDYFVTDLLRLSGRLRDSLFREGWEVKTILNNNLLAAKKDGISLQLGNIEINEVVTWKHNGDNGVITFPVGWLRKCPVDFYNKKIHVVEPELGYVLKINPSLMNPEWVSRDKDKADVKILQEILLQRGIDLASLHSQVRSF